MSANPCACTDDARVEAPCIVRGFTWVWANDVTPDGWTLQQIYDGTLDTTLVLRGTTNSVVSATIEPEQLSGVVRFVIQLTAEQTLALIPGVYKFRAGITLGADGHRVLVWSDVSVSN